jgi:hypothetical protein
MPCCLNEDHLIKSSLSRSFSTRAFIRTKEASRVRERLRVPIDFEAKVERYKFSQLSALPLALKNEKVLKTQLMQFSLISAARQEDQLAADLVLVEPEASVDRVEWAKQLVHGLLGNKYTTGDPLKPGFGLSRILDAICNPGTERDPPIKTVSPANGRRKSRNSVNLSCVV